MAYNNLDDIRTLFAEYAASLEIDLGYQNYDEELKNLPGKYALPKGRLYMAQYEGDPAGCVALRQLDGDKAEIKRLYVRPRYRQHKIGGILIKQLLSDARSEGYSQLFLDTLPSMSSAIALYKKLGFQATPPYYNTPIIGTEFYRLDLNENLA